MIMNDKSFRSNCLIQAIKHKLLDWKHIKIKALIYFKSWLPHLHFYWQDDEYDYHFTSFSRWGGKPIFKGNIHRHNKGVIKRTYKQIMRLKSNEKIKTTREECS